MIFDCDAVTELVLEWQHTGDNTVMEAILAGSRQLVEAIVSSYNPSDREDLIQENYFKIQNALKYYNVNIANLHNYLTTVIKNTCITYSIKQDRQPQLPLDVTAMLVTTTEYVDDENVLVDLITRNRERFKSLPVVLLDDVTEYIYIHLVHYDESYRRVVRGMCNDFMLPRSIATLILHSTLIYMRLKYISNGHLEQPDNVELTLLPDLQLILGDEMYEKLVLATFGMVIKIPS